MCSCPADCSLAILRHGALVSAALVDAHQSPTPSTNRIPGASAPVPTGLSPAAVNTALPSAPFVSKPYDAKLLRISAAPCADELVSNVGDSASTEPPASRGSVSIAAAGWAPSSAAPVTAPTAPAA